MNAEALRFIAVSVTYGFHQFLRNCRLAKKLSFLTGRGSNSIWPCLERNGIGHGVVNIYKCLFKAVLEALVCLVEFLFGDVLTANQVVHVEGSNRALCLNQVVHHGLRHRRIVAFVVTTSSVADDVDDNVFLEFLTVLECQLRYFDDSLWVVAVYVENRRLNCFGYVG